MRIAFVCEGESHVRYWTVVPRVGDEVDFRQKLWFVASVRWNEPSGARPIGTPEEPEARVVLSELELEE